jgi:hypothetical protein
VFQKALNMSQICMGRDHPDTIRNRHLLERVIKSRLDRNAYNEARREYSIEELAMVLTRTNEILEINLQQKN